MEVRNGSLSYWGENGISKFQLRTVVLVIAGS